MPTAKIYAAYMIVFSLFLALSICNTSGAASRCSQDRTMRRATVSPQERHKLNLLLWDAFGRNDYARFRRLLALGADPNTPQYFNGSRHTTTDSSTWLILFAALGDAPTVKALLAHGARVNARGVTCFGAEGHGEPDPRRSTALIDACCRSDNQEVIEILLRHGADVNARDASGNTPLGMAVWQREWEKVRLLLRHGARRELLHNQERMDLAEHTKPH